MSRNDWWKRSVLSIRRVIDAIVNINPLTLYPTAVALPQLFNLSGVN